MKRTDRLLQRWRIAVASRFIPTGARVLDIGCFDGALFHYLGPRLASGVGIDPTLSQPTGAGPFQLIAGRFPRDLPPMEPFDAITMLAVLEHIPPAGAERLGEDCARLIKPGGHLIITVPSPIVDHLVRCLRFLGAVDGMRIEDHHGFEPSTTPSLFSGEAFSVQRAERFQFGLNHLFVFKRQIGARR